MLLCQLVLVFCLLMKILIFIKKTRKRKTHFCVYSYAVCRCCLVCGYSPGCTMMQHLGHLKSFVPQIEPSCLFIVTRNRFWRPYSGRIEYWNFHFLPQSLLSPTSPVYVAQFLLSSIFKVCSTIPIFRQCN